MEVASALAALATTSVGLDTLTSALTAVASLCQQMKDSKTVCTRAYERLRDILDELQKLQRSGRPLPAQSKIDKLAKLLHSFLEFLQKYVDMSLVYRLMKYNNMMDELKRINEEIDTLVALLNVSTARVVVEWREQWEQDCELQMQVLMALVDNSASVLSEVRDARAQVEAMTVLKFEFEQRASERSSEMLGLLKKLYTQIVRVSKAEVPSVPSWFIPSGDVVYESSPFAQGSFGAVHFGRWNSGARVVVKTLLVDDLVGGGNRTTQSRILGEIDIWYRLHHPNVIKMYGACHVSSPPFIVCEEAGNGNMAEYLGRSPQHQSQMWRLLYQAALGLEYLHKSHVVHGDLKLNNILVGSDGTARLADFGLSSVRTSSATSTASAVQRSASGKNNQSEQSAGALRWRAPECLKGRPKFASDVYSLGMCILEAATGEPPFATVADDIVFQLLRHGEIPDQPDELDDEAWELIVSMTAFKPSDRWTLGDVISRLRKLSGKTEDLVSLSSSEPVSTSTSDSSGSLQFAEVSSVKISTTAGADEGAASMSTVSVSGRLRSLSVGETLDIDPPKPTWISGLLDVLQGGTPELLKDALRSIYRAAHHKISRSEIVNLGGVQVLLAIAKTSSSGYNEQLYAYGALRYTASIPRALSSTDLTSVANGIRDPTDDDIRRLHESLMSLYPDYERAETVEMISCLASAKPMTPGLDLLAARIIPLLLSGDKWLPIGTAHAIVALGTSVPTTIPVMVKRGVIPHLVRHIRVSSQRLKVVAVEALGLMAENNFASQTAVATAGGIGLLVDASRSSIGELRLQSLICLSSLALNCSPNQDEIVKAGAVETLVNLIRTSSDEDERAQVARLLAHLMQKHPANQALISKSGVLGPLVDLVRSGSVLETTHASLALGAAALGNEGIALAIASLGGLEALVDLARVSTQVDQMYMVLMALFTLGQTRANANTLVKLGAKDVLSSVMQKAGPTQRNFAARVLELLSGETNPASSPAAASAVRPGSGVVREGPITEKTGIAELAGALRGGSNDNVARAVKWLYRHAFYRSSREQIHRSGIVRLLLPIAENIASGSSQQLYAFGCLSFLAESELGVDQAVVEALGPKLHQLTQAELQGLFAGMNLSRPMDERVESFELLRCLLVAKGEDSFVEKMLRASIQNKEFLEGLKSPSHHLAAATAHAVNVIVDQRSSNESLLVEKGVLPMLVNCLSKGGQRTIEAAAEALWTFARHGTESGVVDAGALLPLINVVRHGVGEQSMYAVLALAQLAKRSRSTADLILDGGGIGPLIKVLRGDDEEDAVYAAVALEEICTVCEPAAGRVVGLGGVEPLVDLIRRTDDVDVQMHPARVLMILATHSSTVSALEGKGVREVMTELQESENLDLAQVASLTLLTMLLSEAK